MPEDLKLSQIGSIQGTSLSRSTKTLSNYLRLLFPEIVCTIHYNTISLPSVSVIALRMFCGAKTSHHTLTPIIKQIKSEQGQTLGSKFIDKQIHEKIQPISKLLSQLKKNVALWSLCTLYLHACLVRVTVGDSGLCCCTCVTYFEC